MNKLTIPTILVATVMVAGIFAFIPVEKATTVHTTISAVGFATDALGVGDIATGAINADALATDAVLEIQTMKVETTAYTAGTDSSCVSNAPFIVYYQIANLANGQTVAIAGTSGAASTFTGAAATVPYISGSVGGAATETVTFTVGTGATTTLTIVSGIGSTAACT